MSAFLVSKTHIDVLVTAARSMRFGGPELEVSNDELGRLLWAENMKSLRARYDEKIDDAALAGYCYAPKFRSAVETLKAIHCYEYQACEHRGWSKSVARKICRAIEASMIHRLPGYDAAPWGIEDAASLSDPGSLPGVATSSRPGAGQ